MALEETLGERFTVRICTDAHAARKLAPTFLPDVLVLDMLLPGMRGVDVLSAFTAHGLTPLVLVTTRVMDEALLRPLADYGVDQVMMKPCSVQRVARRVEHLSTRLHSRKDDRRDSRDTISTLLRALRIPVQRQGYFYLLEAIARMAEQPDQSLSKELYPAVGRLRSVRWTSVERGIRTAIASAWQVRDQRVWQLYFPPNAREPEKHPTNAEFIYRLAQQVSASEQDREYSQPDPPSDRRTYL